VLKENTQRACFRGKYKLQKLEEKGGMPENTVLDHGTDRQDTPTRRHQSQTGISKSARSAEFRRISRPKQKEEKRGGLSLLYIGETL
jgi:hypothetical protein